MKHPVFTGQHSAILVRLVRALRDGVTETKVQLGARCLCAPRTLDRYMSSLHELGLCRNATWEPRARKSEWYRAALLSLRWVITEHPEVLR